MTNNPMLLPIAASCAACSFTTLDMGLLQNHNCETQARGGQCEDYPCCGHEMGDCNGLLYGSDEAIKSDPHLLCDHETGYCPIEDEESEMAWEVEMDRQETVHHEDLASRGIYL